jgi:3'-phosphoadenosine 5'-phosphosulfate sulfotransferase (PAPS reductase)/FAD synthetase
MNMGNHIIDLFSYDKYIVSFSGGKDSTATFLYLLDHGVPTDRIELWHQEIDGREKTFFDWEITPDYCRRFAEAFVVAIYFQWKEGGFYRELMRENSFTAPNCFELPGGGIDRTGGQRGKLFTRCKFPQCSPDLKVRWCSSYLKIDVCSSAIINQQRFRGIRTLVLSGERGEESAARAKYNIFEPDRADLRNGRQFTGMSIDSVLSGIGKNNKCGTL